VDDPATGWHVTVETPRPGVYPQRRHARLHRHDPFPAGAVPHLGIVLRPLRVTWVPQRRRFAGGGRTVCPRAGGLRPWHRRRRRPGGRVDAVPQSKLPRRGPLPGGRPIGSGG
jgi:hypothetical protein